MAFIRAPFFIKRLFSSSSSASGGNALQHLKDRCLVKLEGPDASSFLQGLMTNDINHISGGVGSMFTMFLNIKGRILYDVIVYKTEVNDAYLIECDAQSSAALQRHLKVYKVKRQVTITGDDSYTVHVLYNPAIVGQARAAKTEPLEGAYDKKMLPESSSDYKSHQDNLIFKDPRMAQLGYRILSTNPAYLEQTLNTIVKCSELNHYRRLRYTLGVGEGGDDLLTAGSFPLECNCDYLHGVSFHKGCYIGQEVTARTHHTGVIRKRLMPLFFTDLPTVLPDSKVIAHNDVNLGKLRGIDGNVGLALLRVNQALELGTIPVGNGVARVVRPDWWPVELPKEKYNIQNS